MATDRANRVKLIAAAVVASAAVAGALWHGHRGRERLAEAATRPAARVAVPAAPHDVTQVVTAPPDQPAAPEASAERPEPSAPPLEEVIERAMPAVVMIETQTIRGSGFFLSPDLILTSHHVVGDAAGVSVTMRGGAMVTGHVRELGDGVDLAIVEIDREVDGDVPLPLGTSAALRLGQGIVVLGWAHSEEQQSVSRGIITGLRRALDRSFLQIDAAPHPGDSGGPVLNRAGEVVGITTFRANDGSAGYAIPIDDAKPLIERAAR